MMKMWALLPLVSLDCLDTSMEDVYYIHSHISSIWVDIDTNNVDISAISLLEVADHRKKFSLKCSTFVSFSTTKLTHLFAPP